MKIPNIQAFEANILGNTLLSKQVKFNVALVPNKRYYLYELAKMYVNITIAKIELLPYSAATIDGYNQLAPLDFSKFYITLVDTKNRRIIDNAPLVTFSELGALTKSRMLQLENIDFFQSYISWNGTPLVATAVPFTIPFLITSYNEPYAVNLYED